MAGPQGSFFITRPNAIPNPTGQLISATFTATNPMTIVHEFVAVAQ
jgi:hypothetical protein